MKLNYFFIFFTIFFITSCKEIKTDNSKKAYKFWIKSNPNDKLNVINGEYWQSAHWTLEYRIYLELSSSSRWWENFAKENNLIIDSTETIEHDFGEKPKWFNPSKSSLKYKENSNFDQGSRYFNDTLTGKIFIYETQL